MGRRSALAAVVMVGMLGVWQGRAAGEMVKQDCMSTGVDDDAEGQAAAAVRHGRGKLQVKAKGLAPGSIFSVKVAGVRIGTLVTNAKGKGRGKFSSRPRNADQLLGVDPRGATVSVSDDEGEDVLECEMPDGDTDPGKIRCCVADGEHHECEDRTAEECQAENGVNLGEGSCFPNPCEEEPPSGEHVRCCMPDEDGPECEIESPAACSEHHGVSLGTGTCDPNPCGPPPSDAIRCCLEHEGEQACAQLTAEHCSAEGGNSIGPGSCEPNLCAPPPDAIQCCFDHQGEPDCDILTPDHCALEGGTNAGPGSCDPNPCGPPPPETTRCCLEHEGMTVCENLTSEHCASEGGADLGPGECEPSPCG